MTTDRRTAALDRFERVTELPLLLLSVAMIPLLVVPLVVELPEEVDTTLLVCDWFVWAAFAFEFAVRFALTGHRLRFVRREWPDLLIVLLPLLRPLRIVRSARALRLLRLGRLAVFLAEAESTGRRVLIRHHLHYALLVMLIVVVGAAGFVYAAEEGANGNIDSFAEALWWAITTVTTVGYGDTFPVTPAGRGVAAFLMISGIALFGVLTANLAAFLVERGPTEPSGEHTAGLDEVARRLAALEEAVARLTPPERKDPS